MYYLHNNVIPEKDKWKSKANEQVTLLLKGKKKTIKLKSLSATFLLIIKYIFLLSMNKAEGGGAGCHLDLPFWVFAAAPWQMQAEVFSLDSQTVLKENTKKKKMDD